jgi:hypothetical protein
MTSSSSSTWGRVNLQTASHAAAMVPLIGCWAGLHCQDAQQQPQHLGGGVNLVGKSSETVEHTLRRQRPRAHIKGSAPVQNVNVHPVRSRHGWSTKQGGYFATARVYTAVPSASCAAGSPGMSSTHNTSELNTTQSRQHTHIQQQTTITRWGPHPCTSCTAASAAGSPWLSDTHNITALHNTTHTTSAHNRQHRYSGVLTLPRPALPPVQQAAPG